MSMDVIPEEMWLHIANMLELEDLVRFSHVSRLANIISKHVKRWNKLETMKRGISPFRNPVSLDQVKGWPNIAFLIRLYYPAHMNRMNQHSLYHTYGHLSNVYFSIHNYNLNKDFGLPPSKRIYQLEYSTLCEEMVIPDKAISHVTHNPDRDSMERIIIPKNSFTARYSNITDLSSFSHLQSISLIYCEWLTDITPLKDVPEIRLTCCNLITSVDCLGEKQSFLQINSCEGIRSFETVGNVHTLDLSCSIMTSLSFLSKGVKVLVLRGCVLFDLSEISVAKNLEELDLSQCTQIEDLTPIGDMSSLRALQLRDCPRIMNITPLASLKSLEMLDISYTQVENIEPLSEILPSSLWEENEEKRGKTGKIESLKIFGCENIRYIPPSFRKIKIYEDL